MVQGLRRAGFTDSALIRLLARLNDMDGAESPKEAPGRPRQTGAPRSAAAPPANAGAGETFVDRLSAWLRWTDAMSLYTALQDEGVPDTPSVVVPAGASSSIEEDACQRVRAGLAQALTEDRPWMPEKPNPRIRAHLRTAAPPKPLMETRTEFAPYRRHYQGRQIAMENAIEPLRARLRTQLADRSPRMAKLSTVDAVMERVMGEHERRLLSALPALLEKRFARLRAAAEADENAGTAWLDAFHQELEAVLAAELDLRWQPIDGLLAALNNPHLNA